MQVHKKPYISVISVVKGVLLKFAVLHSITSVACSDIVFHCVKSVRIRSYSGPNEGKCGPE